MSQQETIFILKPGALYHKYPIGAIATTSANIRYHHGFAYVGGFWEAKEIDIPLSSIAMSLTSNYGESFTDTFVEEVKAGLVGSASFVDLRE